MKRTDDELRPRPIVIGHRGASGYRPEHTLAAYELAIEQGADFIEPDLVPTKDGALVVRHENEISGTTDVAAHPEFADRRTTKMVDGVPTTGWFTEDFTLAEIKTLRAKERIPEIRPDNTRYDGRFEVPTFAEVIALAKRRAVGIYPETKHPTYFAKEGRRLDGTPIARSLGTLLVADLVEHGFTDPRRVFIQSFEFENLIELRRSIMPAAGVELPLVQLYGDIAGASVQPASNFSRPYDMRFNALAGVDLAAIYGGLLPLVDGGITPATTYGALLSQRVFDHLEATYATGIGPWKDSVLMREDAASDWHAHPFLGRALRSGLLVHPYTLRAEARFLVQDADGARPTVVDEAVALLRLGVHGYFIDQPDLGVLARERFLASVRSPGCAAGETGVLVPGITGFACGSTRATPTCAA